MCSTRSMGTLAEGLQSAAQLLTIFPWVHGSVQILVDLASSKKLAWFMRVIFKNAPIIRSVCKRMIGLEYFGPVNGKLKLGLASRIWGN